MKNLVKTIQNTIFQQQLFSRGAKIVVGVSGGPDSVCLLYMLTKIAAKADLDLIIIHVNYGLRDKDSTADENFVKKLAEKYGLPTYILRPVVKKNISESELRDIRYKFFEKVRQENNFDLIVVAHNADDQVETFLMRVIRGSGLQGLSAIKYKNGNIVRPLLGIYRKDILEYLKKNNLKFRTDKTNKTDLFFRNKVRNKLIPYLENNFNTKIKETISGAVASIAEDYSFLDDYATELAKTDRGLSAKELLALHPALQRRILLLYIRRQKTDLRDITSAHIEELLRALRSTKSKNQVVVFKGLKLTRKGDKVTISCL